MLREVVTATAATTVWLSESAFVTEMPIGYRLIYRADEIRVRALYFA
jgi:hypothetical protein